MKSRAPSGQKRGHGVLLFGAAVASAAIVTLVLVFSKGGQPPTLSAATPVNPASPPPPASAAAPEEITATQTWSTDHRAYWLGNRAGAAFELLSENKVHTWFGPNQPALVIRCASRATEVFVYTRSATRIEPNAVGKSVTVGVDNEPATAERWLDSEDKVALFSPDGAALAQRLLKAQTLRFGYSPHNADDVVAQFHVAGLARLLQPVARECGWKK